MAPTCVFCCQDLEACNLLEELDLSGNRISALDFPSGVPSSAEGHRCLCGGPLGALQRLHTLRLNSNRLQSLRGLECLVNLRELQVADNELTHVGGLLSSNKKLEKLNVAAN